MLCPTMLQDVALKCCERLARPYDPFDLENMEESECLIEFRVKKRTLQLSHNIVCEQTTKCDEIEAIFMPVEAFFLPISLF